MFWAVAGASVLVKGPVSAAILCLLALAVALLYRSWRVFFWPRRLAGYAGSGFRELSLAWPIALYFKGQFDNWYHFFIITENLGKFGDPSVYPAGVFLAYALQWQFPLDAIAAGGAGGAAAAGPYRQIPYTLPLFWAVAIMLVYLIPRVRLPWYLLPVVPPASLLTAAMLHEYGRKWAFKLPLRLTGLLFLLPAIVLSVLAWNAPFTAAQLAFFRPGHAIAGSHYWFCLA